MLKKTLLYKIDVLLALPCAHISNGATEKTQTHAENCHVPKIEGCLEKAIHPSK